MKFTKPINREVEIDGHHFIVSFDVIGIEFRLKGKRKTARVAWPQVLDIARGEDGADARTLLGLSPSAVPDTSQARRAQNEDALARTINPPAPQSQPDGSAQAPPATPATSANASSSGAPSPAGEATDRRDEQGRAVTAGEVGPES